MEFSCKVILKRTSGDEIHRFRADSTTSFDELVTIIQQWWPSVNMPQRLLIQYTDPEGDTVLLGSAPEWAECISVHGGQLVRLTVMKPPRRPSKALVALSPPSPHLEDETEIVLGVENPPEPVLVEAADEEEEEQEVPEGPGLTPKLHIAKSFMRQAEREAKAAMKECKKGARSLAKELMQSKRTALRLANSLVGTSLPLPQPPAPEVAAEIAPVPPPLWSRILEALPGYHGPSEAVKAEDVATVLAIFPGLDEATVISVLHRVHGNVRQAIEMLLSLS